MIIGLPDIQFAKHPWLTISNPTIQTFIRYEHEVKDLTTSNKSILKLRNNLIHNPSHPIG
jgi:hypothetical protein